MDSVSLIHLKSSIAPAQKNPILFMGDFWLLLFIIYTFFFTSKLQIGAIFLLLFHMPPGAWLFL